MKRLLTAISVIFLSSVFALSQNDTPPTANWQTFAPAGMDFSVEVPVQLKSSSSSGSESNFRFDNVFDGTYFFIFNDNPKNPFQYNRVMDFIRINKPTGRSETVGEFETEKFVFTDNEDFHHTILTAKSKNRIYVFQTLSPSKDDAAVERFFASLRLDQKLNKADNSISTVKQNKDSATVENAGLSDTKTFKIEKPDQPSTPGNQPIAATTDKSVKPIKFLSKPRAEYTDFARFYQITGKVVLRITFLANGTIGEITPLKKQPFGLTPQAIAAARRITFEPAMKNGVPYPVTRPVEYSFIIY